MNKLTGCQPLGIVNNFLTDVCISALFFGILHPRLDAEL